MTAMLMTTTNCLTPSKYFAIVDCQKHFAYNLHIHTRTVCCLIYSLVSRLKTSSQMEKFRVHSLVTPKWFMKRHTLTTIEYIILYKLHLTSLLSRDFKQQATDFSELDVPGFKRNYILSNLHSHTYERCIKTKEHSSHHGLPY